MTHRDITVAVGLSGGVDSSVAAYVLKKKGYNVVGITMMIWDDSIDITENSKHACYGPGEEEDLEAAIDVCKKLNIEHHTVNLVEEFKSTVLDYFRKEYLAGRTPNPCVKCNSSMKFGFMLDKAKKEGVQFDLFATGHYAKIEKSDSGEYILKKGSDPDKDQSYFLAGLNREDLNSVLFPLGDYTKENVRRIAREIGYEIADKEDSQDFIAGGDYTPLFSNDDIEPGEIVDENGNILGKHRGIVHYTVGQRRGLGITAKEPMYVLKIDPKEKKIIAGTKKGLLAKGLVSGNINYISTRSFHNQIEVKVKIRQNHMEAAALLNPEKEGKIEIIFREPQLAVTPGQSVVFYNEDVVLGSGIIESVVE